MLFLIGAAFLAGFIDAIVGGGGMISLPTLLTLGLPPQIAIASNKMIGISTAIAGSTKYIISKKVTWDGMNKNIPVAIICGSIGAYLTTLFSNEFLRYFIFFCLIGLAVFLMFHRNIGARVTKPKISPHLFWIIAAITGVYDGFFGPGTGTFIIIGLIELLGYNLLQAAATGRIINLSGNIGGVLMFAFLGLINYQFVFPGMIAAFVGGMLGATYSVKFGSKGIRPILFISVFGLLLKMAISFFLKH